MSFVVFLPLRKIINCHYLGSVESEINTLTYDEAHPNFFFDHYNLNPIEDLENCKKTMDNENPFRVNVKSNGKMIDLLVAERNKMVGGNIFLKAL